MATDILLTGIPRSGTTLSCALLNQSPNVVALVEPMDVTGFTAANGPQRWQDDIDRFLADTRRSILGHGYALGRIVGGTGDNTFSEQRGAGGLRQGQIVAGRVWIEKPLTADFTLIIKHPNAFTAMLSRLAQRYRWYAIIRNPLSVLASWNSLDVPLRQGRAPAAEAADQALARRLSVIADGSARQVALLNWYYEQYLAHLPRERILRYEDIIVSQGRSLNAMVADYPGSAHPLASKNTNGLYGPNLMRTLHARIASGGTFDAFYSPAEIASALPVTGE